MTTNKATPTLRKCTGSARFGIEPHEAPVSDFPIQPSRKDGLGPMCVPHWKAYVKGLREARADQKVAASKEPKAAGTKAATKKTHPATPMTRVPTAKDVEVAKAEALLAEVDALPGPEMVARVGQDDVQAALETIANGRYGEHPLGNSVLGSHASITALTRDQMHAYFARRYGSANIVVAAAGNLDWTELVRLITEACTGWIPGETGRTNRTEWAGVGGVHQTPQDHAVMDQDWTVTRITREHKDKAHRQLGTSGSGNHFVEFGVFTLDQADAELGLEPGKYVSLLSHSGSRGAGAAVCNVYSNIARNMLPKRFEELGITPAKMSAAGFSDFVTKQINDFAPAIKAADLKP